MTGLARTCGCVGVGVVLLIPCSRAAAAASVVPPDGVRKPDSAQSTGATQGIARAAVAGLTNGLASDAPATPESTRDPFWPVGFAPSAGAASDSASLHQQQENQVRANETEWRAAQKLLIVRGVMGGRGRGADGQVVYGALINGEYVEAGGIASVVMNGKTFRWRVTRVNPDGPVFDRLNNK